MVAYAEATARALERGEAQATVLALSGDLGAGKTTFTQALAKALGVVETVTSPTFVVMKRYSLLRGHFSTLVHIDLYRIEDESELAPLRIREDIERPENLVVIEWPERAPSLIPAGAHHIHVTTEADTSRTITHTFHGNHT
jgi:tRNA threonylcarbamoyladenosine biosynthesis protein TsaE